MEKKKATHKPAHKVREPVDLPKCNRCGSTETVHSHNPKDGGAPELICRPCHRKEHGQPPE